MWKWPDKVENWGPRAWVCVHGESGGAWYEGGRVAVMLASGQGGLEVCTLMSPRQVSGGDKTEQGGVWVLGFPRAPGVHVVLHVCVSWLGNQDGWGRSRHQG